MRGNVFVQVSILLEVLHVHNTAIARLQGLTNALRVSRDSFSHCACAIALVITVSRGFHFEKCNDVQLFGRSRQVERCVHALVVMLQVALPLSPLIQFPVCAGVRAVRGERVLDGACLRPGDPGRSESKSGE